MSLDTDIMLVNLCEFFILAQDRQCWAGLCCDEVGGKRTCWLYDDQTDGHNYIV